MKKDENIKNCYQNNHKKSKKKESTVAHRFKMFVKNNPDLLREEETVNNVYTAVLTELKEQKKENPFSNLTFISTMRLLSDDELLSEAARELFIAEKGNPMQDCIYQTLSCHTKYTNFKKNKGKNSDKEKADEIIISLEEEEKEFTDTVAEIYFWQTRLSEKIGRFYYTYGIDEYLLECVISEFCSYNRFAYAFWEENKVAENKNEPYLRDRLKQNILERTKQPTCSLKEMNVFLFNLKENDSSGNFSALFASAKKKVANNEQTEPREQVMRLLDRCFEQNKAYQEKIIGIKDIVISQSLIAYPRDFWSLLLFRSGSAYVRKNFILSYDKEDLQLPTKDELFFFAIALSMNTEDFKTLCSCLSKIAKDNTRYAVNTYDERDSLILAIIRDIHLWYQSAYGESECAAEFAPELTPLAVLMRVDKALIENGFAGTENKKESRLIFHPFMMKYSAAYKKKYLKWKEKNKCPEPDVIDDGIITEFFGIKSGNNTEDSFYKRMKS